MSISDDPPDADAKIRFLTYDAVPRRVLGHEASLQDLSEKIGIKRETLRDQKSRGKLSSAVQSALAHAFDFRLDWKEWQSGSAEEFKKRYLRGHSVSTATGSVRRTDVPLMRGERQEPVVSQITGLAAVEIDGAQFGRGSAAVEVMVSCGRPVIAGAPASIQSGRLHLKCSPAVLTKDTLKSWTATDRQVTGTLGTVRVSFEAGTRGAPAWRLTANGPGIGNIVLDPDFAALEELAPGDEVTVVFGTWLSEIEEIGGLDTSIALVQPDGSQLPIPVENLSKLKQRVIECIRKTALKTDANGYVEIASHVLKIVEAKA